ncbi:ABC transporter permease [Tepidimonas taiwanensis]|uniref:Macrolide export ATP-binding/permease protein MacB n=1 Tax=Tepidimonas taiwanensis TaxID=307486 RepID=A0A554X0Z5_9BURK|nr:ABC transporter permease [Tepidimonas taiwanensis]MCX7691993.1 ABC transporter permease [Tepidimonas taiwanensis]TSE29483.1 Macrolide export ATP-binding/permease protein MacB [Tepidimonas taiwanensis]UBQ05881.1 ABC transporter permease [Tepidimonas taiwanensis]
MWLNTLVLALRSIRRNLLRSFLTVLGVVIGVAAVVTMVTVGNGATRAIQQQIASLGTNLLQVRPGQRLGPGGGAGAPAFKLTDAHAIATQTPGVLAVAAETRSSGTVVANGRNWSSSIVGGSADWLLTNNWALADGRPFTDDEHRVGAAVCIIGETVRRELYGPNPAVGDTIRVRQVPCEVVGVLAPKGQGAFGQDQDDLVLMPINTLHRRVVGHTRVFTLHVSMLDGADASAVKATIREILRERRSIPEGEEDNFNVLDTQQLAETMAGTTRVMTMLLGAVAAVSLLVGGIGIMNIMLVSVTERTREIGLRLAIGALEREVMGQFLIEAVVLAALGGVIGLILALGASLAISQVMAVPFVFDPAINAVAFAFSALIGVVFGYVPARRAARLDPIEALRHE